MILIGCFYFMLGSCLGSFMHEIYSRYQPNLSVFSFLQALCLRSSRCHFCQKNLTVWQLIPVFSWLYYRRKTACCHKILPSSYFWIELSCGFFILLLCFYFPFSMQTFILIGLGLLAMPIILIDCRYLLIPDFFQFILIGLAVILIHSNLENRAFNAFLFALFWQICSALFAFFLLALPRFYYQFRYKIEAMGIGDLKLAFSLGLFLTFNQIPIFILLAASLGLLSFVMFWLFKKRKIKWIPFAPALVIAQWLVLFWQVRFV